MEELLNNNKTFRDININNINIEKYKILHINKLISGKNKYFRTLSILGKLICILILFLTIYFMRNKIYHINKIGFKKFFKSNLVINEEENYSIKAIYKVDETKEKIKLIGNAYLKYIDEMFINDKKITPVEYYKFKSPGNYIIYILIDISSLDSILSMFNQVYNMISISFIKNLIQKILKT